jgi:hypothetical protein
MGERAHVLSLLALMMSALQAEALVPLTVGPHVEAGMWPRVSEMMIERTEDLVRRFVRREVVSGRAPALVGAD